MSYGGGSYGGGSYAPSLPGPPPTPPSPPTGIYDVFVVDQAGAQFGQAVNARVGKVSWELNGPGAADVTLATTDPDATLMLPGREVQIWLDGVLLWWGPIVRPQAGLHETTWQCAGLLWYFAHRFMGRADRVNQLSNGDFEAGETDWSFSGVTHAVDTATFVEGAKSEKLTGTVAAHNQYAAQTYTHPAGGYPGGDFLTAAVYVYVTSADYLGPAFHDRGLMVVHSRGGNVIDEQGDTGPGSVLKAVIDDDTPRDTWVPLETGTSLVQEGDTVEVRLYPPHGVAYFDLVTLTYMESLSFGYPSTPADVATIIAGIVDYAQNRIFDHGKSDLNIATAGSATGTVRQVAYQFAEHRGVLDAILEFVRQGICDIDIALTSTTRTFTTYAPTKGSLYGTTLELDVNVADFTYSVDLENAASSVVMLGPGDGPDRPEGSAIDTSLLGGAFTMEIVEVAADRTTVGQLDARAAERLLVAARPEILEVTTLPGAAVIGNLTVGDTVPILISDGWVDINAVYRVAAISADLLKDQATLTLNPVP